MKLKYILIGFIIFLMLFFGIALLKPVKASAPPPAARFWMFINPPPAGLSISKMVTVTVTWPEGARTEKLELKTLLKH